MDAEPTADGCRETEWLETRGHSVTQSHNESALFGLSHGLFVSQHFRLHSPCTTPHGWVSIIFPSFAAFSDCRVLPSLPSTFIERGPDLLTCSNGIKGIEARDGTVCCVAECGMCGGKGCGRYGESLGLNNADCCIGTIIDNGTPCGEAPCVITGTSRRK